MRRNLITILLSIEIMLNAVNLTFVAFGRHFGAVDGQVIVSFVVSVMAVIQVAGLGVETRFIQQTLYSWISSGDLQLDLAFRLDPLSSVMILVVTGIGFLIHVYSTAYMHDEVDSEYARYFS